MKPAELALMAGVEDGHWWYRCLRELAAGALTEAGLPRRARVLDVGCGAGGMLARLRERFPEWELLGVDADEAAVARTRSRGLEARRASANALGFSEEFDAALCLDVLCHGGVELEPALAGIRRALKPGGVLVVNVPAFDLLKGRHDEAVGNTRRFRAGQLSRALAAGGFAVERAGYWNLALSPALLAWRALSRLLPGEASSDLQGPPSAAGFLLYGVARLELALAGGARLPAGSSAFLVARA